MTTDNATLAETRPAGSGALRKGWADDMLARTAQTADRSAPAPKPMASETRRRMARRGVPAAAQPTAKGGRRATRLTLATRQDD